MRISATVHHEPGRHEVTVRTDDRTTTLDLPAREDGPGSAVNGGEPASDLTYRVHVESAADAGLVADLVRETDLLAEVHGTLRAGRDVELSSVQISAP